MRRLKKKGNNCNDTKQYRRISYISILACGCLLLATTTISGINYKCGPMPNVMVALPNIGGALCSTPQSLADAHYWKPCSNAAKTRNPLKFRGVPQSGKPISAASGPKFTVLSGHMEEVLRCLTSFFPIVDTCLSCENTARQCCAMVPR